MIVLTQEQWLEKIKAFLPAWFSNSDTPLVTAYLQALAKVMTSAHQASAAHLADTFLETSYGAALDSHGEERGVARLSNESDTFYRRRVKRILDSSNLGAIKTLIDLILFNGECEIREDMDFANNFFNRESFMNRYVIGLAEPARNTFSVVIKKQEKAIEEFFGRSYANREDFCGSSSGSQYVYEMIVRIVDDLKALGTMYRVIETTET
jgi:hypothetical protein